MLSRVPTQRDSDSAECRARVSTVHPRLFSLWVCAVLRRAAIYETVDSHGYVIYTYVKLSLFLFSAS